MGETCSSHGRDEKCLNNLIRKLEDFKGRDHVKDVDAHGRIILKQRNWRESVNQIHLV
jgi:hypothetical protein